MEPKPQYIIPDIEAKDGGYTVTIPELPEDLCQPAIKAARRLQSLPDETVHVVSLIKCKSGEWFFALVGSGKVERLR